uniref:Cytochrome P450 n=1 Tax=Araucaria cunninghamii TaxID=56994 RepID=A0A0D6QU77_ARACU
MDPRSSISIGYYCASVAIALIVLLIINGCKRRRLPPGPLALPLLGHLHLLENNLHDGLGKLSDKYGPLMTLNFGMKTTVVASSSAMAKAILNDHDLNFANRSVPISARCLAYDASDLLWSPYGPRLRLLKKMCVKELLSAQSLEAMHHIRRVEVRRTVRGIYEDSVKGVDSGRVEVAARAIMTSLNVATCMMWSKNSDTSAEGKEFKTMMGELVYLLGLPNVSDLFSFLEFLDLQGVYRRTRKVFVRFDKLFDSMIEERLSGRSSGSDFLQLMLDLAKGVVHRDDETESIQLTMKDVKAMLLAMVGGATDTTSSTVEWAMAELLQRPEILKRAQKELKEVVGLHQAVEESHIPQLHYLQAIVKEVLRLHPAAPLLVPRCAAKSVDIGGYLIPKGTQVLVNVWKIQRNPQVWKDPLVFDPERFVDGKMGYNGRDFDYLPFGSGRRICAGISMGALIIHYTLASFLHSFDWELPAGEKLDMREQYGLVVHKAVPLVALAKPRLGSHLY